MLSTDKKGFNVHEPEFALDWVDSFKDRCRTEKKVDVEANGGKPADLQVMEQVSLRCAVESLMKVKLLVAPTAVETMPFKDIETVVKKYLQPCKRVAVAEQYKFVATTQKNAEPSGALLAKLWEAALFCEFAKLKTFADPEAYMI